MRVNSIDDIVIDHVKPVDKTLRYKEKELEKLKIVSEKTKEIIIKKGKTGLAKNVYEALKNQCEDFEDFKRCLLNELESISEDSQYRLMSSNLNSDKSNFMTYKKFLKDDNGNCYGIIYGDEENCFDKNNEKFVICHKLNNLFNDDNDILVYKKADIKELRKNNPQCVDIDIKDMDINLI